MPLRLRNLVAKLELPTDDWVLSRFGGNEPPVPAQCKGRRQRRRMRGEPAARARAGAQLAEAEVAQDADCSVESPQSGARLSLHASSNDSPAEPERQSRAS